MKRSRKLARDTTTLAQKTAQLALIAPQVIAWRLARGAAGGPLISQCDRKELRTMVAEKQEAFSESYRAMAVATLRGQLRLASTFCSLMLRPMSWGPTTAWETAAQMQAIALDILRQGLGPVHRKVVSNGRRLARRSHSRAVKK